MLILENVARFDAEEYEQCASGDSLIIMLRSTSELFMLGKQGKVKSLYGIKCQHLLRSVRVQGNNFVALVLSDSVHVYCGGNLLQEIETSGLIGCEFVQRDLIILSTRGIHLYSVLPSPLSFSRRRVQTEASLCSARQFPLQQIGISLALQ